MATKQFFSLWRIVNSSARLRPGSVWVLSADPTMPSENERCPNNFYENVYLKILRLQEGLCLARKSLWTDEWMEGHTVA